MIPLQPAVTIDDVHAASARIAGHIVRTPLLTAPRLDQALGVKAFVKAECLQRTGAFKIRGALNKLLQMAPAVRQRGVIAFSAGNHGLGVAAAARVVGCRSVILLPRTATRIKVESCRWWASEVVFYDPATQDREVVGRALASEHGLTLIQPFDDEAVIAGQGTLGLELAEQLAARGAAPDAVLVNCSGGGLSAGVALAIGATFPEAQLIIVEPQGFEKMGRSLASGQPEHNPPMPDSIMDAIIGPRAGTKTLAVLRQHRVRAVSVADADVLRAMALAFETLKIVVEPGGAAALAAVQARRVALDGRTVAIVCSGGNVDRALFARALLDGSATT